MIALGTRPDTSTAAQRDHEPPAAVPGWLLHAWSGRWRIALAAASVAALTLAMLPFREHLGVLNVLLLFLILSLLVGLLLGIRAAATGAILAFLAFDFLFIPPYNTLTVADSDHVLGLFVYLGVAMGSAMLMSRLRTQTDTAIREYRRTSLLYDLNRSLVRDVRLESLLRTIADHVVELYGSAGCRILIADNGELRVGATSPAGRPAAHDRQAMAMATHAIEHRVPAGLGTAGRRIRPPHGTVRMPIPERGRPGDALYVPIVAADRALGVLEVTGRPGGGRFTNEDERLLTSFADQVALAMERTRLTEEATRAAVLAESDRLKSAMLAAVSHDLRTPLAAIKASASAMLDTSVAWSPEDREDLLTAIEEETDRLALMVANFLDLSRIEGGALRPDRDWHDLRELVEDVVRQMRRRAGNRSIAIQLPDHLPLVYIDYVEISQVLVNLVGNAIAYSADGTAISIGAEARGTVVEVSVRDEGDGIPETALPRIFDPFYRAGERGPVAGTGIGLAICKGLVEAHGGRIWAESPAGQGTTMRFTLPLGESGE